MNLRERNDLDRHITGNGGEDQLIGGHEVPQEIVDTVDSLLDMAVTTFRNRTSYDEENMENCHVCGEVDGHSDLCFVPALKKWFKS